MDYILNFRVVMKSNYYQINVTIIKLKCIIKYKIVSSLN